MVGKVRDEATGVAIKEFVALNPKMYSYLVDDNISSYKKAKGVSKNGVLTTSHNECKNDLLKRKCLRHLMNRIQSKNQRMGTYEINKISLSCFNDNIFIQNNGCDGLALGFKSYL